MEAFLAIALFFTICACLLAGFPVAFTLAGVSLLFALIGDALGLFPLSILIGWPLRIFGTMTNATLFAVPLFILMGIILERSNVARDLLQSLGSLFGKNPGGLAITVTMISTLLAASTGIVGATVVMMGLLALPIMLQHNYDPAFSAGTIASAGTLGVIIPPSILLVLLGDILASAYAEAQRIQGNYAPDTISVGDLFAGALFPGLILAGSYMVYQFVRSFLNPALAPAPTTSGQSVTITHVLRTLIAPIALIFAVLGSVLTGAATPTEAAAVGTIGACCIAAERLAPARSMVMIVLGAFGVLLLFKASGALDHAGFFVNFIAIGVAAILAIGLLRIFYFLWRAEILAPALHETGRITAMVFAILICAGMFSLVFRGLGGDEIVRGALETLPGGQWTAFILVMLAIFLLGFILDFIEITFIVVPIVAPILIILGFDPIWLGIMIAINLQTSFLTPPFGFALFYLRGVAPDSITTKEIYKGVMPFIAIQLLVLAFVGIFPAIATWLPTLLFN